MSRTEAKRYGSIALLTTMLTGLLSTAVIWLFSQAINVEPMVKSVERLAKITVANQSTNEAMFVESQRQASSDRQLNSKQYGELAQMIYRQNERFSGNEAKLHRVMVDCKDNSNHIKTCPSTRTQ